MSDISKEATERLAAVYDAKASRYGKDAKSFYSVTADTMRALSAEVERLQAALLPFAEAADECDEYDWDDGNQAPVTAGECRAARDALERRP